MLDEYRRKRDFSKTPEPKGRAVEPKARNLFFCVQKHLASHLHYDLRLQHKGVLLSWAVPKGPSLDPTTKRLAMHVEDHPVEYGEFEGVIPEGYGAGIVMLWDRGTWTPQVDDVDEALKKGDLKFTLDGYKLKGSWVLVRTRGGYSGAGRRGAWPPKSNQGRAWLLIKHRDQWSGEIDITEFAPRSVKSDGDFEDILASDMPAVWLSERRAKGGASTAPAARARTASQRAPQRVRVGVGPREHTKTLLAQIIERAARLKAEREKAGTGRRSSPGRKKRATRSKARSS